MNPDGAAWSAAHDLSQVLLMELAKGKTPEGEVRRASRSRHRDWPLTSVSQRRRNRNRISVIYPDVDREEDAWQ